MSEPYFQPEKASPKELWHGGECQIPAEIAVCPECGGPIVVMCTGWHTDTGQPIAADLQIDCEVEEWILEQDEGYETGHRWWQSDWQPVKDAIVKWCDADRSILQGDWRMCRKESVRDARRALNEMFIVGANSVSVRPESVRTWAQQISFLVHEAEELLRKEKMQKEIADDNQPQF